MPPPKRKRRQLPKGINPDRLPNNVQFDPRGRGRWVYRDRRGPREIKVRLGDSKLTLSEIHKAVEEYLSDYDSTFKGLSMAFRKSQQHRALSPSTQKDYLNCHNAICGRQTKNGKPLGDMALKSWKPGGIRKYRDTRAEESPSRAAHELRYIKRLFQWGIEYEYHQGPNPGTGVKLTGLSKPRKHYVQDADYQILLNLAPLKIALMSHIAYLTGLRKEDVRCMTRSAITDDGLLVKESKTGKSALIIWTKELQDTVNLAVEDAGHALHLFPSSDGEAYRESALNTAWQRLQKRVEEAGGTRFQFKDLRAKHATDFDEAGGDASHNLGHSSPAVTLRHYLRKPRKVTPIR